VGPRNAISLRKGSLKVMLLSFRCLDTRSGRNLVTSLIINFRTLVASRSKPYARKQGYVYAEKERMPGS
jgi:hypothetical protein